VGGVVVVVVLAAGLGVWAATRGSSEPSVVRSVHAGTRAPAATTTAPVATAVPSATVPTTETPAAAAAPAAPTPAAPASAPAPPYAVGESHVTLEDPSRPTDARAPTPASPTRSLPVIVHYPTAGGQYPLVVFAHGFAVSAGTYADFTRDLAAQGFVVVAPDFPLSSSVFAGEPTQSDIDNQARDVGFLITRFTSGAGVAGPWAGHVAATEAGVVGHSDGGSTVARAAENSCCVDTRIGAAAVLSGDEAQSGGQWDVAGSAPLLFVQGTADGINPWVLTQQLYDDAGAPKMLVAINGAGHLEPYTTGPQRGAIVTLVADFFRARLVDARLTPRVIDDANAGGLSLVASQGG